MPKKVVTIVVLPVLWLIVSICEARNNPSSRPSEQKQTLPEFTPEAPQPFVLPPVDETPSHATQNTGIKVILNQIVFSGNSVFDEAKLQNIAKPFLHRAIDVGELEELRYRLTQHYIKNGYVNSGAVIPTQTFKNGLLNIQLIEGKLTAINIEGNGWLHPDYIRWRLMDDKPFNSQTFQDRYLQLLNDPLIEYLNGNLKPLPELGQSALDLHVTRARPYQLALHLNNYNPPSIGAEQLQAEAWVRNLTRWGDKFDFRFDTSKGSAVYAGGMSIPLNAYGTLFDFHFETGKSSIVEEPLNKANIGSHVTNFSWTLSYPVYQTAEQNLILGVNLSSRFNQTSLLDQDCFKFNKAPCKNTTVALRFFQDYSGRFEHHVFAARSTFSMGLDALGSTLQSASKGPDSRYFAWLGQVQHAWKVMDNGAQLRLRGNLQLSNQAVLSQEKIAVGGVYSVRGYRENELVRDNGYSTSIEFHYPLWDTQGSYPNALTIFPFMDYGAAWNDRDNADYLHSLGIGLSWQGLKHIKADFFYAHDLNKAAPQNSHDLQDDSIFFNVSTFAF
ncbi:ShlB/FhaC/HecB family hemolysin secretion/activation protein [Crenothrix polyspora]|uniref:Putative Hemolysin activation/secretion protein n=1 Tax=Crenothrix polyspora TaxID=360316 RepID=A0A1R4HAK4_9GAMM|nr:ShlB/FhaC/HecB family hemolysin secretion/activation protein [Crenothrix polyspora]SJM92900.1 putative Hemolysin activation/secretion protein [Crenothrix polyspora]